eukprot:403365757
MLLQQLSIDQLRQLLSQEKQKIQQCEDDLKQLDQYLQNVKKAIIQKYSFGKQGYKQTESQKTNNAVCDYQDQVLTQIGQNIVEQRDSQNNQEDHEMTQEEDKFQEQSLNNPKQDIESDLSQNHKIQVSEYDYIEIKKLEQILKLKENQIAQNNSTLNQPFQHAYSYTYNGKQLYDKCTLTHQQNQLLEFHEKQEDDTGLVRSMNIGNVLLSGMMDQLQIKNEIVEIRLKNKEIQCDKIERKLK